MYIDHRLGSEVADSRLESDAAIRFDDEKPVESDGAANVTAERHAHTANFRAYPLRRTRDPFAPLELLRAAVERFFQKCAGGVLALPLHYWPQRSFALGAVDAPNRYLVNSQLARSFGKNRLENDNPLQPARRALRTSRRRVCQHRQTAPAHGQRLVEQRNDASRRRSITDCIVGTVVANDEHVEGRDPSLFREADFHPPLKAGTGASDEGLFFAADAHHHRSIRFFRQQCRDDHGHAARDLAAESAAGVFADENDVIGTDIQPARDRWQRLRGALRARVNVNFAVLPIGHRATGFERLMAGVRSDERLVKNECRILEAGIEVAICPLVRTLAHRKTALLFLLEVR